VKTVKPIKAGKSVGLETKSLFYHWERGGGAKSSKITVQSKFLAWPTPQIF